MSLKISLRFLLVFLFASGVFSPVLHAQLAVEELVFEQDGAHKVPNDILLFNTRTRKGQAFDQTILDDDIKRLFATGYFADVAAETRKRTEGGLEVVFKLAARKRIRSLTIEGNQKFKTEKLREQIAISEQYPLDDKEIQEATAALRKFYRSEGYNDAVISPAVSQSEEEGYVDVVFKIKENLRLKVASVSFVGNTVYSSWRLKRALETKHSYLSWLLEIGLHDERQLERDQVRIRDLYWDRGYLDFKIDSVDVKPQESDPEYVDITFHLYEGDPYKIRNVSVEGAPHYSDAYLLEKICFLKQGDVYDHGKAREAGETLESLFHPLGYADFSCRIVRFPDFETHSVDVVFQVEPGRVFRVRDIHITGNRVTKDHVIRREMAIQPGDLYDNERVKLSKSRLMGLNYFEQVEPVSVDTGEEGLKDISVSVKEKDTMKFNIGAGWSDTDSLAGVIGFEQNNFDITDPYNYFQGGGQRFVIQGIVGLEEWGGMIGFSEPWLFGIPLRLDVTGYSRNRTYEDWKENRLGFDISLTKKMFDEFTSLSLGYRFEGVRVYDMEKKLSKEFQDQKGTDLVGTVHLSANRDTRDDIFNPSSGYQVNLLNEFTSQIFGASHNYYRFEIKGVQYVSFFDKAIIAHAGAKLGAIQNMDGSGQVPLYERYFLGGGDTLRGFPYRSIGPVDKNEDVLGGDSMFLATAEISHPIYEWVRGAVFVDAGGSFKDAWHYPLNQFNVGAGYGLRIFIPQVNYPIRLDLAYPIVNNQKGVKNRLRFHFNIGFNF